MGHAAGFCLKFGMILISVLRSITDYMQNEPGQQPNGSQPKSVTPQPEVNALKSGLQPTAPEFKPQSRVAYVEVPLK
jgi:hypothetical protein